MTRSNAPKRPVATAILPFTTGKSVVPGAAIMAGGMISTVTSRCSLSNSPASIAISSRPYTRMVPELSMCTNGTSGIGTAAAASNADMTGSAL